MDVTTIGTTAHHTLPQARALITDWATGTIAHARATPAGLRVRLAPLPGAELVLGQLNVQIDGRARAARRQRRPPRTPDCC